MIKLQADMIEKIYSILDPKQKKEFKDEIEDFYEVPKNK